MMFKNKIAVVTGAGGTLCSAIGIELAKQGAKVVLVGRTKEKLDVVDKKIQAFGGETLVYPCDVTDETAVNVLADMVRNALALAISLSTVQVVITKKRCRQSRSMMNVNSKAIYPKGKRGYMILIWTRLEACWISI